MRTMYRLTAALVAVTLASCGDAGEDAAVTTTIASLAASTTVAATTASPAPTPPPTAPTTTVAPTTTTSEPEPTVAEGPGAPEQLAAFLSAYDLLAERLPPLLAEVTADSEDGEVSDELYQRAYEAGGDVFDLARLVPVGLAPAVSTAVHDAVMMMAGATSAYLFAPGFDLFEWPEWSASMTAAMEQLAGMRAIVVSVATAEPELAAVAPGSREAAEVAMLQLEIGRRFGHGGPGAEIDASVPFVHWIGELSEPVPDGTQCFLEADTGVFKAPVGDFVDGVGGCAVVFYDGIDQPAEIEAWRASPGETFPTGEFVAFVYTDAGWEVGGSVE